MERRIVRTSDGSKTIQLTDWNEQYHSMHGAVQEAYHVFIQAGLGQFSDRELEILEIGFGTGLNALITLLEAPSHNLSIAYTSLEMYPVPQSEWSQLDYGSDLDYPSAAQLFKQLHLSPWNEPVTIGPGFSLCKRKSDVREFATEHPSFDLIYFDAFGARVQPDLWTLDIFERMYKALRPGGILVTYAAKGSVRRAMQTAGFVTERLPGPPGKREMLRASKPALSGIPA
ncbi:tRNA (5-methylaminomethyl-2-thiouridine)(34)-methyltransferase MnmD [Robiginitalea aurantiaca]|uniref:tRNA (5-methylaminomethyl-2-thiouridine)(34)-methyltransferase MnmD n=1 Tax=Robiginitalea aurantiaca TaxID=3056915 RepID=A0ABT7WD60_9FLAO|nr:tRNA (5-methylaminomethyl-2-thiouridine)(34)-methyltransferase MnmD [Robiginitalea aurantiaca]MDM9630847.1 tRNA (5-methylaminomethyl-2-thiouridine)(34)-methyltransferase MnmD [Robiginitalea aurantiaca]